MIFKTTLSHPWGLIQGLSRSKTFFKKTSTQTQAIFKMSKYLRVHGKPWIERVLTPSISIIYPHTQNLEKGFFSVLFSFLVGWNKSRWRLLLTATYCKHKTQHANQYLTVSYATVSQNWRLCWGMISGVYLRISSSYLLLLFVLVALLLRVFVWELL